MAERRFTDLELERQLAGDLPEGRAFDAQATAADRARLAELRAEHEAFLRSVDVDNEVRRIQQRVANKASEPRERRAWWKWFAPASALAAAAAAVLVFLRPGDDEPKLIDDIQVKGDDITLVVHVAAEGGSRRVTSGDEVMPGDRLRFEVNAAKPGYLAVVGIDGSGQLTVYHPGNGTGPMSFDPRAGVLPGAIALDATPGEERFFALYSETPFAFDIVLPLVEEGAPLPPAISRAEVVLNKKLPP
jgi:hypothetical protein